VRSRARPAPLDRPHHVEPDHLAGQLEELPAPGASLHQSYPHAGHLCALAGEHEHMHRRILPQRGPSVHSNEHVSEYPRGGAHSAPAFIAPHLVMSVAPRERAAVPYLRAGWLLDRPHDVIVIARGSRASSPPVFSQRRGTPCWCSRSTTRSVDSPSPSRGGATTSIPASTTSGTSGRARRFGRSFSTSVRATCPFTRCPHTTKRSAGGDVRLDLGGDLGSLREALLEAAPDEGTAIDRYLTEVVACARAAPSFFFDRMRARARHDPPSRSPFFRWSDRTTEEMLRSLGLSPA
jgi:hypothetical protein